ncbi:MAG: PQQ-binding-like beta-propeller repeat protein [Methyloceanibacter sp.]
MAAIAMNLAGCGPTSAISNIRNPFADKKTPLPGERIAVITDPGSIQAGVLRPVSLPSPHVNAAWSQPGGTPSNNLGHLALNGSLRKVWTADAGTGSSSRGRLSAVPLVAGGKVFTLDAGGNVSAFAASSGAKVWSVSVTPKSERSSEGFGGGLAFDGSRLIATTGFGTVVGIDPGNGAILWTRAMGRPIRNSPTATGGKVFFVSTDNSLYAVSANDGSDLWRARGLPQTATLLGNASPAVGGGRVVAPFPAGDVIAFEAGSGEASWRESLTRTSDTSAAGILGDPARPVIDRGTVFAVSHGGRMIATSESSGARIWTRNIASTQMPWVAGDAVFVVDTSGKLMALSRTDGDVRWVSELPQGQSSSRSGPLGWMGDSSQGSSRWHGPVLAGGKVWVVSGDGLLVGADARTGQVLDNVDLGTKVFVTPVVAGGRMYILADNAKLIALN